MTGKTSWLLAISLLLIGHAADAKAVNSAIEEEDKAYLLLCADPSPAENRFCEYNQKNFLSAYMQARAGIYQGQRNVAYMLGTRTPGVSLNPIQSCAWRMVIISAGHPQVDSSDTGNLNFACGRLNETEAGAARRRAAAISREIASAPPRLPQAAPSSVPRGRLDGTASPLVP
ncbi:hypothetical protein HMPREF0731_2158 [Pseudoroseomonas cervicalis ATCC 49957]|uniref:Uncharacterized protein n=1 Tax=Pseudoroseomonas cervicalis ATCC 49957 TaxID=525371 RepID=D5RM47_9PROT|nr:hypothetical protein HMPREF0731_2158 [Pseudoroseomonas cervicalis ATCC 49957]